MLKKIVSVLMLVGVMTVLVFTAVQPVSAMAETQTVSGLTDAEIAGLKFMREEEKLARDVYLALYAKWGQPTFQNIAASEQTHMDAVLGLLNSYNIADPASTQNGVFTNPELQSLYNQLVAQGSASLASALKVGAAIEEIDIRDLETRLAQTGNAGIKAIYTNLERGSENHLRAFTGTLSRLTGETYQPQYLSTDKYNAIISGSTGYGNGQSRGGGPRWQRR